MALILDRDTLIELRQIDLNYLEQKNCHCDMVQNKNII